MFFVAPYSLICVTLLRCLTAVLEYFEYILVTKAMVTVPDIFTINTARPIRVSGDCVRVSRGVVLELNQIVNLITKLQVFIGCPLLFTVVEAL